MASRKQRGSGVGPSKSKKANTKKNNKKNTKKNKPKANASANANANFNANVNFSLNNNTGYHQAMAMGRAALNQLKSEVNPNAVRQMHRNFKNLSAYSAQMRELVRPLKPMTQAEKNALAKAVANLEREIAEGRV
jgi:hypothetical protein